MWERALSFQKDEIFRAYVLKRIWFVLPLSLVFVLIGSICAVGVMIFLSELVSQPVTGWSVAMILGTGVFV